MNRSIHGFVLGALLFGASAAQAQYFSPGKPGTQGSSNVHVMSHIPLGRIFTIANIDIEQEMSRPYVYVSKYTQTNEYGFDVISLKDVTKAAVIARWRIEDADLHAGTGCLSGKYFKLKARYYYAQGCQFGQSGPDAKLGAVIFDVTGLPDPAAMKEAARIHMTDVPNGFHETYTYKHSDGRVLFFGTTSARYVHVYDMERVLAGAMDQALYKIPVPDGGAPGGRGYHDMYVGYDPGTHQDRYYGAGAGGYYIYNISDLAQPVLIASLTGIAGISSGHTFTPSPDGKYAIVESEYQYAPLRMFDLKPVMDGTVKTLSRPIGAWTPRWEGLPHNHEVRWPYVFVSSNEDGFHMLNWMDPANPYAVGYYDTYDGPNNRGKTYIGSDPEAGFTDPGFYARQTLPSDTRNTNGVFGIDVRNADGLVVVSDRATGFWAFKIDGFDGWNGHQWGVPNISSAQDWDNGPEGAPKAAKVS